jgi:hypothetical protein
VSFALLLSLASQVGCYGLSRFDEASRCPTDVALCEGFEGEMRSEWNQEMIGAGSTSIDDTRAFRGASSLRLHTDPVPLDQRSRQAIYEEASESQGATSHWLRGFFFLPATPNNTLSPLIGFGERVAPFDGVALDLAEGEWVVRTPTLVDVPSHVPFAPNRWTCVELHVEEAADGLVEVRIDGELLSDLVVRQDTRAATPLVSISLQLNAIGSPEPEAAIDLWIDEVIVDHASIGCSR